MCEFLLYCRPCFIKLYRVSHKKGIDKKLLVGAAQGFNSQFFNLFGFSICRFCLVYHLKDLDASR